jgi:antitoxin (DNA-binding transcriptional repressor) of toxin-antitoxin stability system
MKTISISQLKTHLSAELKLIRSGETIVVMDRDRPVAVLAPYEKKDELLVRAPGKPFSTKRPALKLKLDPVAYLIEDRNSR